MGRLQIKQLREHFAQHCRTHGRTDVHEAAGVDARVAELPAFHFTDATIFNVPGTFSRTGYTGEDGVEIFLPPADALRVWNGLMGLGAAHGLKPAGLGARNTLRLECKMALYGNDIDETTNPLESALGWTVRLDKGDFIGRDALLAVKSAGLTRKLVGFEVTDRAIARDAVQRLNAGRIKGKSVKVRVLEE